MSQTTTGQPSRRRRTRRHDPGRRDRLIDAALTIIAERGVTGTTHREIARAADVPLGSMTYHFASLDEILVEAFTRHFEAVAEVFDRRMAAAADRDAAIQAVIAMVGEDLFGSQNDLVLTVELYAAVIAAVDAGADGAVPGLPVGDTIKRIEGDTVVETLDRSALVAVQTPQAFRATALRAAHAAGGEATDDAALVEAAGGRIVVVAGAPANRKITDVEDLAWARNLVEAGR